MTAIDDFFATQVKYLSSRIDWNGLSLIEYGAQHARHSLALLGLGAKRAIAIEGRQANLDLVENPQALPLVTYCADIRKLDEYPSGKFGRHGLGKFDAGLVLGILYHLDHPALFLKQELPRIKDHLFLWSHYAEAARIDLDGYRGAPYQDPGSSHQCALEPATAFWFTRAELCRAIEDNGFTIVDCVEMPTPVSPHYKAVMIHARRREALAKNHKLVVARWDEDVAWAGAYPHVIYDKGGAPLEPDGLSVTRLNTNPEGHETHTYLHHIIQHYDDLDPWTAFVQGHPFDHARDWAGQWCAEPESGFAWIGHWLAEDVGNGLPHHMRRLPVAEAYRAIFGRDGPPLYRFIAGAQFVASCEQIHSKPPEFWQRVQALGDEAGFSTDWGYTCERLWGYLIHDPL